MKIKEYYRLAELQEAHGISVHDLQYAIEQGEVSLAIRVNSVKLLMAKWDRGKITGFGVVRYSGLLRLPKSSCREFADKSMVSVDTFILPVKWRFESFSSEYPFDIPVPNNLVEKWLELREEQLPQAELPVVLMPTESVGLRNFMLTSLKQLEQAQQHPEKVLHRNYRKLSKEDVVVTHEKLQQLKSSYLEQKEVNVTNVESLKEVQFKNDFHRLLANAYLAMDKPSAKKIFLALEKDASTEEDARMYDHDNILLDATGDKLVWSDRFSTKYEKEVSTRTLENELVKVKKLLKEHKIQ